MRTELFLTNLANTTVVSGGMSIPEAGTLETFTVSEANGIFPAIRTDREQFHFKDRDPTKGSEIFTCIATEDNHWTVIRGAEGSTPVAHDRKFFVRQVITAEFLQRLGGGSTTELVNAATVHGADFTGTEDATEAVIASLQDGPTYLPTGIYRTSRPINVLPGQVLLSFGNAVLMPDPNFSGDAVIELVDGAGRSRVDGVSLTGHQLGAGREIYGVFAETKLLEAELRSVRITGFPASGAILSGTGWQLERVTASSNYASGFELNMTESLLLGCRALHNTQYGFTGYYHDQLIGCLAKDNRLGDFN